MATALIIEDNRGIVDLLQERLVAEGFRCLHAPDGLAGIRLARSERPDVVLLDLVLPGLAGMDVCRRLREEPATAGLPIVMLTSKTDELDRVLGLELGADDYVTKPFSVRELVARVKAVLRRSQAGPAASLRRFGGLEVDESAHEVKVDGRPVELRAKEFLLLRTLLNARGGVLTRDQLLAGIGGYAEGVDVRSRTVDVHIGRLRSKLGLEKRRIVTVKGVGYRFDGR